MAEIVLVDKLSVDIQQRMEEELINYETSHGIKINYKRFSLLLKENEEVIGALNAHTAFAEVYIDEMWIAKDKRGLGFGKKLLSEIYEIFKQKDYNNINLVTNKFQAPKFYEKCGFTLEFIRKNIVNPKLSKYFYIKYFDNAKQSQGLTTQTN